MPRTKRPVRRTKGPAQEDEEVKTFRKCVADKVKHLQQVVDNECRNIELAFKLAIGSINPEYLNKTVGELKNTLYISEESERTTEASHGGSQDDGYNSEHSHDSVAKDKNKFVTPAPIRQAGRSARRSRSADPRARSAAPPSASSRGTGASSARRSRSAYRTPMYNKNCPNNYPAITPKVAPQTPLAVLRQPRQGEMVVSMSGSPVMVNSCSTLQPSDKANCNILLQDGTVLSLQPRHLRQSQAFIPFSLMDNSTLLQLKTLRNNIEKVVKMSEKK